MADQVRARGVAWAVGAGLLWGGSFVAPLVLHGYTALEITAGRFVGSGLFSTLVLAGAITTGRAHGSADRALWLSAFALAMTGNFIYFAAMIAGVQNANAPIVTLIIGMLPITIPLAARLRDGSFSIHATVAPALMIAAGLGLVHLGAVVDAQTRDDLRYATGIACAVVAMIAWLIFALANDRTMRLNPAVSSATWSSMQGITLLPLALLISAGTIGAATPHNMAVARPSLATFLLVSALLGVATSWMAMWCWNRASQLLPPALAGQLLVVETLASLTYTYLWYRAWPPLAVVAGATLLIAGVILGIRRLDDRSATTP